MSRGRLPISLLLLVLIAGLCGCYRSHERGGDGGVDSVPDGAPRDASSTDAASTDAGPVECTGLVIADTVSLDEEDSAVTPRVAGLPGGEVAVVYVSRDGAPSRIIYERLSDRLERLTGPVTVTNDSFTWAEVAVREGRVFVAYGRAGDTRSVLHEISVDGMGVRPPMEVPLYHPAILVPASPGLFWMAFEMRSDNALVMGHISLDADLLHEPSSIPTGRYGSGFGALPLEATSSFLLTYPREGPPGVRNPWLTVVNGEGEFGPERQLSEDGDLAAYPVWQGDRIVIVRHGDETVIEPTDPDTFERLDRIAFPPTSRTAMPAVAGGRLMLAHTEGSELRVDDFGTELVEFERLEAPLPGRGAGARPSVLSLRDAAVYAFTVNQGRRSSPWLARIECTP